MRPTFVAPQVQRPPLFGPLVLTVIGLGLAWFLATSVVREQYRDVIFAAAIFQTAWVAARWRASVYVFIVYVTIEGFVVNVFYTLPELNLLKDLMAVAIFGVLALGLILKRERSLFPRRPWLVPFLGFSALYVVQIFNPALPNILVGLVGIRATLLFAVLAPVAYRFFDSRERVFRFVELVVFLSIPVSAFGLLQAVMGPGWVMSLSPGFARAVYYAVGAGSRMENAYFRTFSTFVQTGSFTIFLWFTLLLTAALWVLPAWRSRRLTLAGIMALQFCAFLTTGGRGPFLMLGLSLTILLLSHASARRFVPLVLVMPLILWGSGYFLGSGVQERYETILDFDYVVQRNAPLVGGWLAEAMNTDWAGLGAGYASVASRHVGATPLNQNVVENALAKVRFEAGLPGLVAYVVFIICVLAECVVAPRRTSDSEMRWIVTTIATFVGLSVVLVAAGTPFEVSPSNTLLWFLLGLLARAPELSAAPRPSIVGS